MKHLGTSGNVKDVATQSDVAAKTGFRNRIINGDMRVDRRNSGAAVTYNSGGVEQYFLDRWLGNSTGTPRFSVQQVLDAPAGFAYSAKILVTTSGTPAAGDFCYFGQSIEGLNVIDFALGTSGAKSIALSFWVKSSLAGSFSGSLANSAANRRYPFSFTISAANTWEQKTVTLTGDTTGTWLINNGIGLKLLIDLGTGSTNKGVAGVWATVGVGVTGAVNLVATAAATFNIAGVQLEPGSTATTFEQRPYGVELAMCQRYLPAIYGGVVFGQGAINTTSTGLIILNFPTTRVAPTGILTSTVGAFQLGVNGVVNSACTSIVFNSASVTNCSVVATAGAVFSVPHPCFLSSGASILLTGCEL